MNKNIIIKFLLGISILLLLLKLINYSYILPPFLDESIFNQGVYNLFKSCNYTSDIISGNFPCGMSTGIMGTWLGGIVYLLVSNLFISRLSIALFITFQLIVLIILSLKYLFKDFSIRLIIALIAVNIIFHFPYWYGFIQNLGELPGALLVGWGFLMIRHSIPLMFLFFGLATWLCKFVYLPYVLSVITIIVIFDKSNFKNIIYFILPLLIWIGLIAISFDIKTAIKWILDSYRFTCTYPFTTGTGFTGIALSLKERLTTLDWATYKMIDRFLIIFFSIILPVIIAPFVVYKYISWKNDKRKIMLIIANISILLMYAFWYFRLHPYMWARHIQPALYLGFGFLGYLISETPYLKDIRYHYYIKHFITIVFIFSLGYELYKYVWCS